MDADPAQLSSLSTALDELTSRVTNLADAYAGSPREDVAASLYEIERNLTSAATKLRNLVRRL